MILASIEYDSNIVTVTVAGTGASGNGTVNVTVANNSGVGIGGAVIHAVDERTSVVSGPFLADSTGKVSITLAPASYTLTASALGFNTTSVSGVTITSGGSISAGITMSQSTLPYGQSMLFQSQTGLSRTGVSVVYKNVNSTPITCACLCQFLTVTGQVVGSGLSADQTVNPGQTTTFSVTFNPAVATGIYLLHISCIDPSNILVSVVTSSQVRI